MVSRKIPGPGAKQLKRDAEVLVILRAWQKQGAQKRCSESKLAKKVGWDTRRVQRTLKKLPKATRKTTQRLEILQKIPQRDRAEGRLDRLMAAQFLLEKPRPKRKSPLVFKSAVAVTQSLPGKPLVSARRVRQLRQPYRAEQRKESNALKLYNAPSAEEIILASQPNLVASQLSFYCQ